MLAPRAGSMVSRNRFFRRRLLRLRYSEGLAIDTIARQLGRSEDAVYRALFATGIDGLFSDFPGLEAKVRDAL